MKHGKETLKFVWGIEKAGYMEMMTFGLQKKLPDTQKSKLNVLLVGATAVLIIAGFVWMLYDDNDSALWANADDTLVVRIIKILLFLFLVVVVIPYFLHLVIPYSILDSLCWFFSLFGRPYPACL